MANEGVVVLGIPVPSSSPVFLTIVAIHVAAGLSCTLAGAVAMLAPKRRGLHPSAGAVYYWCLVAVSLSMAALSILRWPADTHLLALGIVSYGAGAVGRLAKRRYGREHLRLHVTGMAVSYIALLTAFYVDNGPNLPLWRLLPPLAYWLIPSLVGLPFLAWTLWRHPLISESSAVKGAA